MIVSQGTLKTRYGSFLIHSSSRGIISVDFPCRIRENLFEDGSYGEPSECLRKCKRILTHFLNGKKVNVAGVKVDYRTIGAFDRHVYRELRKIHPGETVSYGELARRCGCPQSARAVGNALHRNPVPILIPCHRVLKKDGSLGGFRSGAVWKKTLLELDRKQKIIK